jgi:hypothetical protein
VIPLPDIVLIAGAAVCAVMALDFMAHALGRCIFRGWYIR